MSMIGKTLGHYKIGDQPLGKGGMGEVYRAKDLKLGRDVAIKVLPEEFARDADRVARFQREAKLLASLNHPNIAAIYGLEEFGGIQFLVLELVEGETLADQLKRGPIPVEESLKLALQIAEALEAAHEKGVIHRDLKPANAMITAGDKVKILDFGLAKALADETQSVDSSQSPTLTEAMTRPGMILGTAAYMSPEQAKGKAVDKRADIWAFGCILYECLTGKRAFEGETVAETLAAILKAVPDWKVLPEATPPGIRMLLRRCLEKDMTRRFRDVADVRIAIEEARNFSILEDAAATGRQISWRRRILWGLAASIAVIGAAIGGWMLKPLQSLPVAHVKIGLQPADISPGRPRRTAIAFSPDGRQLVFRALNGTTKVFQLYMRPLERPQATPLVGTEGAEGPVFSPDGQWVGFWAGGELKKAPVGGGPPVTICKIPDEVPYGASWESGKLIIFALRQGGLWQVAASEGEPKQLTELDSSRGEYSHRLPQLLPGGEAVLFTLTKSAFPNWDETDIAVQSLRSGKRKLLIHGGADARYLSSGHLVYARRGVLMAAPFDLGRLEVRGGAVGIIEDIMQAANTTAPQYESGAAQFSVSANGTLAYLSGGIYPAPLLSLVWVDRHGIVKQLPVPPRAYCGPRIAPDGRRLAFFIFGEGTPRISLLDLVRGTSTWLTSEYSGWPVWTPDGARIVHGAGEPPNLSRQPADGSAGTERLLKDDHDQFPASFSPDGKTLIFVQMQADATNQWDICLLSLEGDRRPRPLIQTSLDEGFPELSPDGRWLAYASNESGRLEVYVRPFPGPGGKQQISTNGGRSPAWARGGKELFYSSLGGSELAIMDVEVSTETTFKAGMPKILFKGRFSERWPLRNWDVTSDGQRFIMVQPIDAPPPQPVGEINLIFNWVEELKRRVPSGEK